MLQSLKQPYEAIYISGFALTYYKKTVTQSLNYQLHLAIHELQTWLLSIGYGDTVDQARNQGGDLGHLPPPKFSKHCIAILTFEATFK